MFGEITTRFAGDRFWHKTRAILKCIADYEGRHFKSG